MDMRYVQIGRTVGSCRLSSPLSVAANIAAVVVLGLLPQVAAGWGGGDSDTSIYGNNLDRDWLYQSSSVSIKLEGCLWGYVSDNEDSGCMEDSSEDGTTYWYQMANCRRAQAVFSLYASDSGNSASCSNSNFKGTYVTTGGLQEFIYYLSTYDNNSPFGDNYGGYDDDGYYDDDGNDGNDNKYDELPMCEEADGYYVGLGCSDDGTFSLQYFDDAYCLSPSGSTYDKLRQLNRALKNYKSCSAVSSYGDEDGSTIASLLVYTSETCSALDSDLCTDSSIMKSRRSHTNSRSSHNSSFANGKSWLTKLKYVGGGLLLLASFVMFTGILFTNRRRRRALMQRKYRQSKNKGREDRSHRSSHRRARSSGASRSKSKTREGRSSSSRKSRSKSKSRDNGTADLEPPGVFT